VFLVLVLEGSGYHLDTLLKWVREVWEFLWEVGGEGCGGGACVRGGFVAGVGG
jgi:hypothetical protein